VTCSDTVLYRGHEMSWHLLGLPVWVISHSDGLYYCTIMQDKIENVHRSLYHEQDSNPWPKLAVCGRPNTCSIRCADSRIRGCYFLTVCVLSYDSRV